MDLLGMKENVDKLLAHPRAFLAARNRVRHGFPVTPLGSQLHGRREQLDSGFEEVSEF